MEVAQTHEPRQDLEAASASAADTAPLLSLPSFMPATTSPASDTLLHDTTRPTDGIAPDAWPGGRKVCYAWRVYNLGYGAYLAAIGIILGVGLAVNGGASCERHLRAWAGFEQAFCVLGIMNVLWKHKRVPQLIVDRNAQSDDVFIAASRFTLKDMCAVYGGVLLNLAWIAWLVLGCVWTFGDSNCSDTAPTLLATCSLVLKMHLAAVGTLVGAIVCAASALPVLYFLRPELFAEPSRGATKSLIDRTTKRSVYQPQRLQRQGPASSLDAETEENEAEAGEKEAKNEGEEACAICLSEYVAGEELRELGCGHEFHATCAEAWLQTNKTCAACRRPIDLV